MSTPEKSVKKVFLVEGMTCSGCERTVSRVVGNLEGVRSSQASLKDATVSVEYDPEKTGIDQIRSAVHSVGYRFVGERPAQGQRESGHESVS